MRYMGSKRRIAKDILPIILEGRKDNQYYVEPFVGGFNIIDKVDGLRIGADSNEYLIELYKSVQQGWEPPSALSKEEYNTIKTDYKNYDKCLVGFVAFGCSFSGIWFSSYATGGYNSNGEPRNYCLESKNNILKQASKIKGVDIRHSSYDKLEIPANSIIYCDPPYANTTKYKDGDFDHDRFWQWCRDKHKEGHTVFVSEYNAPDDFNCIWQKEVTTGVSRSSTKKM